MKPVYDVSTDELSCKDLTVNFLNRKAFPGQFSIEASFARLSDALADIGVSVRTLQAPVHSIGLINRLRIMQFAARCSDAKIVHITGDIHFAVLMTTKPVVLTVHDLERLTRLTGIRRSILKLFWFSLPCRRADAICVISEATRQRLLAEVPGIDAKVFVVPTLVSEAFQPVAKPFNTSRPTILAIGTKANKNLPRLAKAMAGLEARLVVVGQVNEALCETFMRHGLDWVSHTGLSDEEMVKLYEEADIIALVSTEEGFGMPIVEAQRVGRPVLASNLSSMPEVAGNGALLVDPFDCIAIHTGLKRLIAEPELRRKLVAAGFENAARFEADDVARSLRKLYLEILSQ